MSRFEILCVTMFQKDFSKVNQMNVKSDIVYANQCNETSYEELEFDGHKAKMISTNTRGVGINRNLALTYATGDICLFADDDVVYRDDVEKTVIAEFDAHPDADIIVFNIDCTERLRQQIRYKETRKCRGFFRMPWGGVRIAFRLSSVRKANIWFTTLFGGGAMFPSGEDSMWLKEARRKGLVFYVSKETIGTVHFDESSWFTGYDENFFYGKGAFLSAMYDKTFLLWKYYLLSRYRTKAGISKKERKKWMEAGREGYKEMLSYNEYQSRRSKKCRK